MTAQIPDVLVLRGKQLALCATPLDSYVRRLRKNRRPTFLWTSTACWRGYTALWEVRDGKLFLNDLEGWIERDGEPVQASLKDALPHLKAPVLATWVDDVLRCPEGRLSAYAHAGFASVYERDRLIHVRKGHVVEEWLRLNPPEPIWYRIDTEGRRTRFDTSYHDAEMLEDEFQPDETPHGYRYWGKPPPADEAESEDYVIGGELRLWPPRR